MRKNCLILLSALVLSLSVPLLAQSDTRLEPQKIDDEFSLVEEEIKCTAAEALKSSYGNVMVSSEDGKIVNLTFSVPYTEINTMLTLVVGNNWYPSHLSICGAGEDKAAIFLALTKEENDSFRHFKVLQKLCNPGVLPWKIGKLNNKQAYVTSIETDFKADFCIKGETIKSGLIFTTLTPKINRIGADLENLDADRFRSKKGFDRKKIFTRETYEDNDTGINGQPFFERGTYKEDAENGRYMEFTLRCQW